MLTQMLMTESGNLQERICVILASSFFFAFSACFSSKLTHNSKSYKAQLKHLELKDVKYIHRELFSLQNKKIKQWKKMKKGSSRVTALLTQDAVIPCGTDQQIQANAAME